MKLIPGRQAAQIAKRLGLAASQAQLSPRAASLLKYLVFRVEVTLGGRSSQTALHGTDVVDRDTTELDKRPPEDSKAKPLSSAEVSQRNLLEP